MSKLTMPSPRVNRIDMMRLDDADGALELMFFAHRGMTREADDILEEVGLGRAHHRILFVIARRDGVTVGELRGNLGVSAQAMHRPLKQLQEAGLVAVTRDPTRHRFKALHLTKKGRELEHAASEAERRVMRAAFDAAGPAARRGWTKVMAIIAENA
jgi:DNA-binding MarR family transcriptional regulator